MDGGGIYFTDDKSNLPSEKTVIGEMTVPFSPRQSFDRYGRNKLWGDDAAAHEPLNQIIVDVAWLRNKPSKVGISRHTAA